MDPVTYKFHFEDAWQTVTGQAGQTLVEMTVQNEIRTPHACLEGGCGSCKCKLIEGKVDMPENEILEDEDRRNGFILACQAKPLTSTISVDFDIDNLMNPTSLYSDSYVDIFDDHLVLKGYYFLRFGQKRIDFSDIAKFKEVRLTYFNGMARHESNWWQPRWPLDFRVKSRKEAFYIKPKSTWFGIGFSAENTREVALLIHKKMNPS